MSRNDTVSGRDYNWFGIGENGGRKIQPGKLKKWPDFPMAL